MKKIAIFVEGATEAVFVERLLCDLVGKRKIEVSVSRQWRGKTVLMSVPASSHTEFYVLLVDCQNDQQVKSQIVANYQSLVSAGYTAIIGLRDLFPLQDLARLQKGLASRLPTVPVSPEIHVAVMELEAWFLADVSHFERIHPALSVGTITAFGIGIDSVPANAWAEPAKLLHQIYQIAGRSYLSPAGKKSARRVHRTVRALSFEEMYVNVTRRVVEFGRFVHSVEAALF